MSEMKVSVVLTSLNQGQFIGAAIESVLRQEYRPLNLIVIDGGSTDSTQSVLDLYAGCPLVSWISEKDYGQSDAANKGFMRADGDVIGWLDSDDVYLPNAVSRAVEVLEKEPAVGMVYGDNNAILAGGQFSHSCRLAQYELRTLLRRGATAGIHNSAVFFRRAALFQAGLLDTTLVHAADYDIYVKIWAHWQVRHLPEALGSFRLHANRKTSRDLWGQIQESRGVRSRFIATSWNASLSDRAVIWTYDLAHLGYFFRERALNGARRSRNGDCRIGNRERYIGTVTTPAFPRTAGRHE